MIPENGLQEKLILSAKQKRPLIIKLGFDPTAPDLHLGHAVVLKKLREFQELDYQIVILVGSFTARIGDPTGKNKSRKPLSEEEVHRNAETYIQQLSKIIDVTRAKIVFNSDWLDQLSFSEIIQILSRVTVAQLMHRHDFNKRFTENTPIAMHELIYPILQGYDSVNIHADIEMGGTDQLFNCTMGRQLQESMGLTPQIIMCMPLLRGIDGKEKMSKSLNNIIGITDSPNEMFGKTMSIPDDLIPEYISLTTDFTATEQAQLLTDFSAKVNPMQIKKRIAKNIVMQYHNEAVANEATRFFEQQFQRKNFFEKIFDPISLREISNGKQELLLVELCATLVKDQTKSAVRRLITSGAVLIDDKKEYDPNSIVTLRTGMKIRIGKKAYFELIH